MAGVCGADVALGVDNSRLADKERFGVAVTPMSSCSNLRTIASKLASP